MGFSSEYFFKSEQIGQKGPKNTQKGPFSENASNFLSPLLFLNLAKNPLFSGFFVIRPTIFCGHFYQNKPKPAFIKIKVTTRLRSFTLRTIKIIRTRRTKITFVTMYTEFTSNNTNHRRVS